MPSSADEPVEQRRAQHALERRERLGQHERVRVRILGLQRVGVGLEEAAADQNVRHEAPQTLLAGEAREDVAPNGSRGRDLLEAEARHLLDQVDLAAHVACPPVRHVGVPAFVDREPESCQATPLLVLGHGNPDDRLGTRRPQLDARPVGEFGLDVRLARPARARQLEQELRRMVRGALGQFGRDALLPACL